MSATPEPVTPKGEPKHWYRRPIITIPLVLLIGVAIVAGVIAYRTQSAFDEVQSQSTPPPEVSAGSLGLDGGARIDTGPAQEALRQRDVAKKQQSDQNAGASSAEPPTIAPTDAIQTLPPTNASTVAQETEASGQTSTGQEPTIGSTEPFAPTTGEATQESEKPTEPTGNRTAPEVAEPDGITILLMGVDAREGEAIDVGVRPDSLAVMHLDEATGSCRLLSVPRDSRATLPGYGESKINHALAVGGIPYEVAVVEDYLGIEIDHYGLVDFSGIETTVDEFGGVIVDNPVEFQVSGQTFEAGTLELNGEQALRYARFRGDSQGDFGRISRQQQVLRSLMDKAVSANLVRMVPSMFGLLSDNFRTNFGVAGLLGLANDFRDSCTADTIETRTIPGDVSMQFDDMMQMDLSFVVSSSEEVSANVRWLLMLDDIDSGDSGGIPSTDRNMIGLDCSARRFWLNRPMESFG